MPKLSDTQLVILSAACQREDHLVLPLPKHLKGGAAAKVVDSLIARRVVEEVEARPGDPMWREADGRRLTLVATDAAFEALGIDPEEATDGSAGDEEPQAPGGAATGDEEPAHGTGEPAGAEAAPAPAIAKARKSRPDSKQAQLVAMLQRPDGASLDEIVSATGWQKHTVRGAIAGALKKKLGLDVTSEKVEGRGRVYRIRTS